MWLLIHAGIKVKTMFIKGVPGNSFNIWQDVLLQILWNLDGLRQVVSVTYWSLRDLNENSKKQFWSWHYQLIAVVSLVKLLYVIVTGFHWWKVNNHHRHQIIITSSLHHHGVTRQQCWIRYLSPYGITRPQWIKHITWNLVEWPSISKPKFCGLETFGKLRIRRIIRYCNSPLILHRPL